MAMFNDLFEQHYNSVAEEVSRSSIRKNYNDSMSESLSNMQIGPQREYILQKAIRPYFGKQGVNKSPIGEPPEFIDLQSSDAVQYHCVCTLFIDIKGSTRLSLIYDLDFVYKFKNAVIQTCVEVIRSFDGNVHRLMGDAVMAFFGNNSTDKESSIADAINCTLILRAILEQSIRPWMKQKGLLPNDFGFRVGCDFGDDDDVLWGNFGYEGVGEISATGLSVDMASKLQGLASKNQTMLGQGLLEFINWPEKYSKIKSKTKGDVEENIPFVVPNLTDRDDNSINYAMRLLRYEDAMSFCALPREFRQQINSHVISNRIVSYECYTVENGNLNRYISASKFIEPGIDLVFKVTASTNERLKFPLKAIFTKTNHGKATPIKERDIEQGGIVKEMNKVTVSKYNRSILPVSEVSLNESTLYRGLHTMKCEVKDSNDSVIFRDWIAILIK